MQSLGIDLHDAARRPVRYWNLDGLPELMLGFFWIIWGGAWLLGELLPHDWRWKAYWLIVPAALSAFGLSLNWLTRRLKERLTFPRAGYVAWKDAGARTKYAAAGLALAAATALATAGLFTSTTAIEERMPAVLSVVLSLSLLVVGIRQRAPHHVILAGLIVVLSLAIGTLTTGGTSMNWLLLTAGAVAVTIGALRLARFLRQHPRQPIEER